MCSVFDVAVLKKWRKEDTVGSAGFPFLGKGAWHPTMQRVAVQHDKASQ